MSSEREPHDCSNEVQQVATSANIVHYERRAGQPLELSGASTSSEVIFLDENTPAPPVPRQWPHVPFHRRPGNEGKVIYIGPEGPEQ